MGLCNSKSQADNTTVADKPTKKTETKTETNTGTNTETSTEVVKTKKEEPQSEKQPKTEPEKTKGPKAEEPKQTDPATTIPYTNRPEDLEGLPKASGAFIPKVWTIGEVPNCSKPLTGDYVTDGKVSFDRAALSYEGVFSSRDEEVAQLQKAIDLKKDAAAETGKANALHEEHNNLYEAGDKDGAKAKLAESKAHREKAKEIHEESLNLAYAGAMSMAIKAVYSKYPSIDYHVFLVDPYEKSYLVAIELFKKDAKYPRSDFLVIPGEGQHSDKAGPKIRPHFEKWMADNNIGHQQITSGSYAITIADFKP